MHEELGLVDKDVEDELDELAKKRAEVSEKTGKNQIGEGENEP